MIGTAAPAAQTFDSQLSIEPLLLALVESGGSDLHCKAGSPPRVRIDGRLRRLQMPPLTAADTDALVAQVIRPDVVESFARTHEADFAVQVSGVGRFRVNAFQSRGSAAMVVRLVAVNPRPLPSLGLPPVVGGLALEPVGLVLVTGPTGSGKSTTLASMVDLINSERECHIVTVEDPIEILHEDKLAAISQREIGLDTADFATAMRAAMRQDPDVILVGEMRDHETVKAALHAAETGHLVLSTLHTTDAQDTIARVVDFFPPHEQRQVRTALAQALKGVVSQRLVPRRGGTGRVPVVEVLVASGRVAEAIVDPSEGPSIGELVRDGAYYGMQSFDQHLLSLCTDGLVEAQDALSVASNPHDLQLEMRRVGLVV